MKTDGKSQGLKPGVKLLVSALALTAFALSLNVTIQKLNGDITSLVGCGAGTGCANVLGSKWSVVLGVIPVSLLSCLLYLMIVISAWMASSYANHFRLFAGWLLLGAALWFTGLQVFILKTICAHCMTMHGLGAVLGIIFLASSLRHQRSRRWNLGLLPLAALLVIGLAVIQYFGPAPDTHSVDRLALNLPSGSDRAKGAPHAHTAGTGRLVHFFNGQKSYRIAELPHLGPVDAKHVMVKYFDYTCEACRDVHGDLEKIMPKHPDDLAVIVLPVALNKQCNPHLPLGIKDHENACEFAKLALRVWLAEPSKFKEFHHWLMLNSKQPFSLAESKAKSLVGGQALEAVDSTRVDRIFGQNLADYKVLIRENPVMPKVLIKDSMLMQGVARDTETFERVLKENYNW